MPGAEKEYGVYCSLGESIALKVLPRLFSGNLRRFAIHFLSYLPLVLVLQYHTGVYQSELSHQPDESAHVVTSLMIHDYLKTSIGTSPLRFAENYYIHYPKVAFGIWPPLFHSTAALWMLLFTRTHTSLLILLGVECALCAATLAMFARRFLPPVAAFGLGLFMILMPAFQNATSVIMVDIFLTVMEFWAALMMVAFYRSGAMRDAIWFGLSTSLAMLTKGNADALVLAFVFMLLLTRRFSLLTRPPVFVAGTMILLLGGPWHLITLRLFKNTIPLAPLSLSRVWMMFSGYTAIVTERLSLPILLFALLGLAVECVPMLLGKRKEDPLMFDAAGAASLLLGIVAFQSIATNSDPDDRYILPALPLLLLFAALGIRWMAAHIPLPGLSVAVRATLLAALSLGWFAKTAFALPHRAQMGFAQTVNALLPPRASDEAVLVCSDSWGEGAFITAMALADRRTNEHIVLRGSKTLSESLWLGGSYSPLFHGSDELEKYMESIPVDAIVVDFTKVLWEQDRAILLQAIRENPDKWKLAAEIPESAESRHLQLYRWAGPDHSHVRKNLGVRMRLMLGRDLQVKQ